MDLAAIKAINKIRDILDKTLLNLKNCREVFWKFKISLASANQNENQIVETDFGKLQDLQYLVNSSNMNVGTAASIFKFIDTASKNNSEKEYTSLKELENYLNSLIAYQNIIQTKFKAFEAQSLMIKRGMKSTELHEIIGDFAYALETGMEATICSLDLYECYLDLFEQKDDTKEQTNFKTISDLSKKPTIEYDYSSPSVFEP